MCVSLPECQYAILPPVSYATGVRFKGYAFQIEMKFTAYKYGFRIVEVPIIFVNRVLGESKMNSGIFGEAVLGVIQLKLNSLTKSYPDYSRR